MTGPLTTNDTTGGESRNGSRSIARKRDSSEALKRLVENLARVFDRLHPPGAPEDGPFVGLSERLRQVLANEQADDQSNEAILSLKVLLHAIEALRERLEYLDTSSGRAYAQLNATEHKTHELKQQIGRLWRMLAHLPGMNEETKARLLDDHANPESRLAIAEEACTALATLPIDVNNDAHNAMQQELAATKLAAKNIESENWNLKQRVAELEASLKAKPEAEHDKMAIPAPVSAPAINTDELQILKGNLAEERAKKVSAIAEVRQLKHRVVELLDSVTVSAEKIKKFHSEAIEAQTKEAEARKSLDEVSAKLTGLEVERDHLQKQSSQAEKELAELRKVANAGGDQSEALTKSLQDAEENNKKLRTELEKTNKHAGTLLEKIAFLESTLKTTERDKDILENEVQSLHKEHTQAQKQLQDIEKALAESEKARETAQSERDAALAARDAATKKQTATILKKEAEAASIKDSLNELERARAALAQQLETVEEERLSAAREHATALAAAVSATETAKRDYQSAQASAAESQARAEEARDVVADLAEALRTGLETLAASAGDDASAEEADHAARELSAAAVGLRGSAIDNLASRLGTLAATKGSAVQALNRVCEHLATQVGEAQSAREQVRDTSARIADLHRRLEEAAARATAAEAEVSERNQALDAAEEALAKSETIRQELAADVTRWNEKANEIKTTSKEEIDRLRTRLAAAESGKSSVEQAVSEARKEFTDARKAADEAHAQLAEIGTVLGKALETTGAPASLAKSAATRLEQLDVELSNALNASADLRKQLQESAESAAQAASDSAKILQETEAKLTKIETKAKAADERGGDLSRDLEKSREEARTTARELAEAHQSLAAVTADLAQVQEQVAEHKAQIEAAQSEAQLVPALRTELEQSRAQSDAAKEVTSRLLDAVKELGHAANAAVDRVGVGMPTGSRHLTRTTARIDRAMAGAEFEIAVESARSVCARAAEQAQALANQVEANRRESIALKDKLKEEHKSAEGLKQECNDLKGKFAELAGLPDELSGVSAERQRLSEELDQLREESARQTAELDSRLHAARAEVDEANARAQALHQDVTDINERLRLARSDGERERENLMTQLDENVALLEAERAGAKEKDAALQITLEERDAQLAKMRNELDKLRMRQTEVMGLEARIRTLDAKLNSANNEVARLRNERDADSDRLNAVTDAESAYARMSAELEEAERAMRDAESALAEERARTTELSRQRTRLEREWKRRLSALEEEIADERSSAARTAAELSSLRGELAGLKTRGRRS